MTTNDEEMRDPEKFWARLAKTDNWRDYILPKRNDQEFWEEGLRQVKAIEKYVFPQDIVIDYGCGIGRMAKYMATRCHRVIGIDICKSFIEIAQEMTNVPNVEFYKFNRKCNHYIGAGMADFIYCISVIQHNTPENRELIMDDIYTFLKPGGRCFINFPRLGPIYRGSQFVTVFTEESVRQLAHKFSEVIIEPGNLVGYGGRKIEGDNELFLIATK